MLRLSLYILLATMIGATPSQGRTQAASDSLTGAIAAMASTGGRIEIAPGSFGMLSIRDVSPADRPLILTAADPASPPSFSGLQIYRADNIVLENVVLDYRYHPEDPPHLRPFQIVESTNITLRDILIDGDTAHGVDPAIDGYPTAYGLGIRDSEAVHLEASEIRGFTRGIVTERGRQITFVGNDLHGLRSDGMNFAQVEDVLILANHFHDFDRALASADHADMIQFWTRNTVGPTRNVTIRNNLLDSGEGAYTQSIFIRNEEVDTGNAGPEMFYRNITIENNVIHNAHLHGISIGEVDGLVIRNNTLIHNPASAGDQPELELWRPRINVSEAARNVIVTRNVAHAVPGDVGRADWKIEQNLVVQDRSRLAPNFYGTVFVGWDWRVLSAFAPRPGGLLDGTGIGASLLP